MRLVRAFVFCIIALIAGPLRAQEMEIPVATQIALFLKVTAFDRRIEPAAVNDFVVIVAFQGGYRQSAAAKDEVVRALSEMPPVDGKVIRTLAVDLDRDDLRARLKDQRATMLYVTPLRGVSIDGITTVSRTSKVTTFSGVPKYIDQGLAVGVRRVGDRPKLLVNLRVAKLEGADFSAEFLKLVQVVE